MRRTALPSQVPVSLVFMPSGETSRVGPLPAGLSPLVRASLEAQGVHHALTRPPVQHMSLGDLGVLLEKGRCRRCYLKQARADLQMLMLTAALTPTLTQHQHQP